MGKPRCFRANYLTRLLSEDENDPSPSVGNPTWRPAQRRSDWRVSFCSRSKTMLVLQSSPKLDGWGKEFQPYTLKGPGQGSHQDSLFNPHDRPARQL